VHLGPKALFAPVQLGAHSRKLTAHLVAKLQNLRFESGHPLRNLVQACHRSFKAFDAFL
jgi:hypothetical protein